MKKVICLLIFLLVLTACSAVDNSNVLEGSNEVTVQTNESKEPTLELQESVTEEFSVLITVKTINVRREPSTNSKEKIVGEVHMGETYTVFEQNKDKDYMWYRIGDDQWIANDGTWCIEYGNDDKKVCPYVLSDEEKGEFLSSIKTGAHCYSAHSKEVEHYINIFNEPEFEFDYNIYLNNDIMNHSSLNDVYRYNISRLF